MNAIIEDRCRPPGGTKMDQEVQERFERIEGILERVAVGMQELEAAQLNQTKAHTKLVAVVEDLGAKVENLTVLVDRLVACPG